LLSGEGDRPLRLTNPPKKKKKGQAKKTAALLAVMTSTLKFLLQKVPYFMRSPVFVFLQ
jgi:hypothetical protein